MWTKVDHVYRKYKDVKGRKEPAPDSLAHGRKCYWTTDYLKNKLDKTKEFHYTLLINDKFPYHQILLFIHIIFRVVIWQWFQFEVLLITKLTLLKKIYDFVPDCFLLWPSVIFKAFMMHYSILHRTVNSINWKESNQVTKQIYLIK